MNETSQPSFENLIEQYRAQGRTLTVHISGDPAGDPPTGAGAVARAAELLHGEDAQIIEPGSKEFPDALGDGDVLLVAVADPQSPSAMDVWKSVQKHVGVSSAVGFHLVIHTATVPRNLDPLLDVRVTVNPVEVYRIETDSFKGETYQRKISWN